MQWSSGYRIRLQCERTEVQISPWTVVFIMTATAICSLGHGLCSFSAKVDLAFDPLGMVNEYQLTGWVIITNGVVDVVGRHFRRSLGTSQLSLFWRPPGAQSAFIKLTEWTLAVTLSHDDSTMNIVPVIIIIIIVIPIHVYCLVRCVVCASVCCPWALPTCMGPRNHALVGSLHTRHLANTMDWSVRWCGLSLPLL